AGLGSVTPEPPSDAVAVLLIVEPAATSELTVTTTVTVALAPEARAPSWAVTTPPDCAAVPWLEVAETNVVPAGTTSVSTAAGALLGPALVTVTLYVRSLPAMTGSGLSVLATDRSAWLVTVVVAVPVLLFGFGSPVLLVAVAWLTRTVPLGVL